MTASHTPGPWDWFLGNANGRGLIRIEAASENPEAGRHIASLTRGAENEANARLIAAAPDLLAALQEALIFIDEAAHNDRRFQDDVRERTRAVIAKAEGRS